MVDQQLIEYIKNQIKLGRSDDIIKAMLKNAGWQDNNIDEAFLIVKTPDDANVPLPSSRQSSQETRLSSVSKSCRNVRRI